MSNMESWISTTLSCTGNQILQYSTIHDAFLRKISIELEDK